MPVEKTMQEKDTETHVTGYKALEYISKGREIADNISIDKKLQSGEWLRHKDSFPIWAGTVVVNEAPGKRFGKTVESQGVIFKVPEEYQGRGDVALVLDNSTIKLTDGDGEMTGYKVLNAKVSKSQRYPNRNGWGIPDADTGIPKMLTGPSSDQSVRYLRRSSGAHIGLVVRGYIDSHSIYPEFRRDISVYPLLDRDFSVIFTKQTTNNAVELSEGETWKAHYGIGKGLQIGEAVVAKRQ